MGQVANKEVVALEADLANSEKRVRDLEAKLEQAREEIIEAWHQGAYGDRELYECLGMTDQEYGLYAASGPKALSGVGTIASATPGSIWYSEYLLGTFKVLGPAEKDPGMVACQRIDEETHQVIDTDKLLFPDYEFGKRLALVRPGK